MLLLAQ